MTCPNCGKEFSPKLNQKYCCPKCQSQYYNKHGRGYPYESITFACAQCGKVVTTEGDTDKRSRFCSVECEKKFWKHPPSEFSGMRNYHSLQQIASREKRDKENAERI